MSFDNIFLELQNINPHIPHSMVSLHHMFERYPERDKTIQINSWKWIKINNNIKKSSAADLVCGEGLNYIFQF